MSQEELQKKLADLQEKKKALEEKIAQPQVYADIPQFAIVATDLQKVNEDIEKITLQVNG